MKRIVIAFIAVLVVAGSAGAQTHADRVHVNEGSDPKAIEIAQGVMEAMGGWDAWDAARYLQWNFFGGRTHVWDKQTGALRLEVENTVILMNLETKEGRVWVDGAEETHPDSLAKTLGTGHRIWVNDAYWMFMPYKLLDPGVTLTYGGERAMEDGRAADVLVLTFGDGVGYTSRNRYDVFVAKDTGLVEAWSFYRDRDDPEPAFTGPWHGWQRFGGILLCTDHGRERDWAIAVHETLPESVFTSPEAMTD